jgi:hypothetical protein
VSINDASFPDFLRNLLNRYSLPAGLLCFEITETTAIANLAKAGELMRELKGMGCHFALDDFGTGMSSFAYLKHLPVDYLKIAGVFVKDMGTDPMDNAIVEAVNHIGHISACRPWPNRWRMPRRSRESGSSESTTRRLLHRRAEPFPVENLPQPEVVRA